MAPLVLACLAVGVATAFPSAVTNRLFSHKRESPAGKHVCPSELPSTPGVARLQELGENTKHICPSQEDGTMVTPKTEAATTAFKLCELLVVDSSSSALSPGKYVLQSPNYPANYSNSVNISWSFTVETHNSISIACPIIDVEGYYQNCLFDWLEINGERFCGNKSIAEIVADSLQIQFVSDVALGGKGFSCDITVTEGAAPTPSPVGGSPDGNCSCGIANRATRIVGGVPTEEHEYPWQAGVRITFGTKTFFCGGSVISSEYVLTAAHCTHGNPTAGQVFLGTSQRLPPGESTGGELFDVVVIFNHPSYNPDYTLHDYALLLLDRAITFSAHISPVCLPSPGQMFADATATASGFGRTSTNGSMSDVLLEVDLRIWAPQHCETFMHQIGFPYEQSIMVCAGGEAGKDSCMGDSGGPLMVQEDGRYVLVGVTSFGVSHECARGDDPSVYSRVTGALDWIRQRTVNSTFCS